LLGLFYFISIVLKFRHLIVVVIIKVNGNQSKLVFWGKFLYTDEKFMKILQVTLHFISKRYEIL